MKRRGSDRGYYVVASYPGIGVVTYQIDGAGVQWLAEHGINTRQLPASFDHGLLEILRASELVYTGGGGVEPALVDVHVAAREALLGLLVKGHGVEGLDAQSAPLFAAAIRPEARLVVLDGYVADMGFAGSAQAQWRLGVGLPDLPLELVPGAEVEDQIAVLASATIAVGNEAVIPLLQCWPGRTMPVTVRPSSDAYAIVPRGSWPERLRSEWSLPPVPGLASVNLFEAPAVGGRLVRRGAPIATGAAYVLVRRAAEKGTDQLPRALRPRSLGVIDGWEAVAFSLSRDLDADTRVWLSTLGHTVREALWALTVIAPVPMRFGGTGAPVMRAGRPLILQLSAPPNARALPPHATLHVTHESGRWTPLTLPDAGWGTQHLAYAPSAPGVYRVQSPEGWVQELVVVVEDAPSAAEEADGVWVTPAPPALEVTLGARTCSGFDSEAIPIQLEALIDGRHPNGQPRVEAITVDVRVPVERLVVQWSVDDSGGELRTVSRDDVGLAVRHFLRTLNPREHRTLTIDAGPAFGAVRFAVSWQPSELAFTSARGSDHQRIEQWLAATLPALARHSRRSKVAVLAHSIRGNPGGPALPDSPAEFAPPDWFALVWRGLRQRHSSD